MTIVGLMEVTIVQEVDVAAVRDGEVTAAFTVLMVVLGVGLAGHGLFGSFFGGFGGFRGGQPFASMGQRVRN